MLKVVRNILTLSLPWPLYGLPALLFYLTSLASPPLFSTLSVDPSLWENALRHLSGICFLTAFILGLPWSILFYFGIVSLFFSPGWFHLEFEDFNRLTVNILFFSLASGALINGYFFQRMRKHARTKK